MCNKHLIVFALCGLLLNAGAVGMTLDECKKLASEGNAEALWQLGRRYENGDGVRKDGLKAVVQYRKAADMNHAKACGRLADLYETGTIVGKDPVMAARYRVQAKGDSGEIAAAVAKTEQERSEVDYIEVALDYIIGRNGKTRNAKKGVQILYKTAKDNPTAQRVFVERWEEGDLDDGLDTLDDDDWKLVLPWFEDQYKKGRRKGGLVLGNQAYRTKRYYDAVRYWQWSGVAGVPKAWFRLGKFYCYDEENGGGPKAMRSDIKAKDAFERCLKVDSSWASARINIGYLCVYGAGRCIDYPRALRIFSDAMRDEPDNEYYPYWYGTAGRNQIWDKFNARWNTKRIQYLWTQHAKKQLAPLEWDELNRYCTDVKRCDEEEKGYMAYILRLANKGYEPAKKAYQKWTEKRRR